MRRRGGRKARNRHCVCGADGCVPWRMREIGNGEGGSRLGECHSNRLELLEQKVSGIVPGGREGGSGIRTEGGEKSENGKPAVASRDASIIRICPIIQLVVPGAERAASSRAEEERKKEGRTNRGKGRAEGEAQAPRRHPRAWQSRRVARHNPSGESDDATVDR